MSHRPRRASLQGAFGTGRRARSARNQPGAFRAGGLGRHPGALAGLGQIPGLPRSEAEADGLARQNAPSILRLQHEVTAAEACRARGARVLSSDDHAGRARDQHVRSPLSRRRGRRRLHRADPDAADLSRRAARLAGTSGAGPARARCAPRSISRPSSTCRSWATNGHRCASPTPRSRPRISRYRRPNWRSRVCGREASLGARTTLDGARCRAGRSRRADQPDRGAGQPLFGGLRDPCRGRSSDRREAGPRCSRLRSRRLFRPRLRCAGPASAACRATGSTVSWSVSDATEPRPLGGLWPMRHGP